MDAARLTAYVMSLPEVEQRETWQHPTFRVGGRIFVSLPDDDVAVVKAGPEEQAGLLAEDPQTFSAAPRVGRHGWVAVRLHRAEDDHLRALVHDAWRSVAPRRLVGGT